MKKILIINDSFLHDKNRQGLINILDYLQDQVEYKFGNINEIQEYDIIYSPSSTINVSHYPTKMFIFGPHFSVFPDNNQLQSLQNTKNNKNIYIQPSEWATQTWKDMGAEHFITMKKFAFPVDTNKFSPNNMQKKENVIIYYKRRDPNELNLLKVFLKTKNIANYKIFDYTQRYNEDEYLQYLKHCKYGIILDAHESQGFAIEEALSCDVPLLVWNSKTMNQEYGSRYSTIPCTSIPYWDERCGEYFYTFEELKQTFELFISKLETHQYSPREYILTNLSTEKCAERFLDMIII